MNSDIFDHGIPNNSYNKHAWILGKPEIGERVWIGAFCLIDALYAPLTIGKGVDVSSGAQILTHTTVRRCISERRFNEIESASTEIGDFCFIGTNAVILMGVTIGHHSVVAAGAVVSQGMKIPPYSLVAGVPAKIIGSSKKFLKGLEEESISVVIPSYNEAKNIEKVVAEAKVVLINLKMRWEIVLVDDGSTDGTGKITDKLSQKDKHVRAVHHQYNKGFTGAMKTAFQSAKNHLVFLAPGDGQFNFGELPKFIEAIRGFDVAVGFRTINEEGIIRKTESRMFHFLCKILLGIHLKEISTVSMWRRLILQSIEIASDDRSAMMLPELIHKALKKKYKFSEVSISWYKRAGGKSKGVHLHPEALFKTALALLKLWYRVNFKV